MRSAVAAATTTGFTYLLGHHTLYVPLTSRCNARTLPMTRGAQFTLPASVVAALCRVRQAEHGITTSSTTAEQQQQQQQQYQHDDDNVITLLPQKLPEYPYEFISSMTTRPTSFSSTTSGTTATTQNSGSLWTTTTGRPTVDELLAEVVSATTRNPNSSSGKAQTAEIIQSIVISGEGEPLLRYNSLLSLIQQIRQHLNRVGDINTSNSTNKTTTRIRLTTNGLVDPLQATTCAQQLVDAGLDAVSIALMTHNAQQYQEWMQPLDRPLQIVVEGGGVDIPLPRSSATFTTTTISPQQQQRPEVRLPPAPFDWVCHFCRAAVQAGLDVELTAVDRPNVDQAATEQLAAQLLNSTGSNSSKNSAPPASQEVKQQQLSVVRWRPYFP
jgi:hypothetical protein